MSKNIIVNGKPDTVENETTIDDLLAARKVKREVVTVELNDSIVDKKMYASTRLEAGDRIEFVYYMGGGQDVADLIGKTPIIKLKRAARENSADIFAKVEFFNPGGSVKDRICLAMIGAARGYKVILTMPETMSLERIYILKAYGAEVFLTSGQEGMSGSIKKAEEIAKKNGAFMPQQFNNPANPEIHKRTTAVEIIDAINKRIDAFVAGVGTGGTITGVGEALKLKYPEVKIIAIEPHSSPVLSGGQAGPHKIQGIGAGFVPSILNRGIIDRIIKVKDEEAYETSRRLAEEEGLFVGISSGAAAFAAIKVAAELGKGKTVVTVFPDTGERYFSMEQFFNA